MSDPQAAPTDFHHVTLSVLDVTKMELFRDKQEIPALVSVKMNHENAGKLAALLKEYLDKHQDGAGLIVFTLEGRFT